MNTITGVEPLREYEIDGFNEAGIPDTLADSFPPPVQIDTVAGGFSEDGREGMYVIVSVGDNGNSAREDLWFHNYDGSNPWGLTHRQVSLLGNAAKSYRRWVDFRPQPEVPETTETSVWIG